MRAQQIELQALQVRRGNAGGGEFAETGVDAVHGRVALCRAAHDLGAGTHARAAGGVELHLGGRIAGQPAQLSDVEPAGNQQFG